MAETEGESIVEGVEASFRLWGAKGEVVRRRFLGEGLCFREPS